MATVHANIALKRDWPFANPWLWLASGFAVTLWSWLWTRTFGVLASDNRILVLVLGLIITGAGVWLRWRDRQNIYFYTGAAVLARLLMGLLFGLLGLALTGLFFATLVYDEVRGFHPGAAFLVAISTVPTFIWAAHRTLKRDASRQVLEVDEETGLALLFASGVCFLGSFTLDITELATDWDTVRLLLRVAAAAGVFASALAVASTRVRRLALSLLFVIHFCAITTACLSAPPAPWIVNQAWVRLFRPYLEFMYLNNAYHFYAPEPGPSSYLWFRVIYTTPDKKDFGLWYKVPRLDEQGNSDHPVALEYQRFIALTESLAASQALPPDTIFNQQKQEWEVNPFWKNRLELVPNPERKDLVGVEPTKHMQIPLRPGILPARQVYIPAESSRQMLASYTRFVTRKFAKHPEHPDWELKSVKVYRVIHHIPPVHWFQNHIPPTDPELYHPYYVGNFDRNGNLIEDQDPYRNWLVPVIRDEMNNPDSVIRDYARLHAGDPNWIRRRDPVMDKLVWTDR